MHPLTKSTWRASPPVFALENCSICQGTGWQLVAISDSSQARRCPCRELTRLVRLKESVGIPQRYEHCTLDNFDPRNLSQIRALSEARRFVERYPSVSRGLFFAGTPGTGKTHLAAGILHDLANRIQEDLLFVDFLTVLRSQNIAIPRADARRRDEKRLQRIPLLVIDGFGAGSPTAEDVSFVQQLLQMRLQHRRATILTGEPVRCRDLFQGCNSARVSQTQIFLSMLHPALLMELLSAVKVLTVTGEDYRRSNSPLFP